MPQQLIQTGAGVKIYINGEVVGFATGIRYRRILGTKYIHEIDSPFAAEIAVQGPYRVEGQLMGFRLRDRGGLDGKGIMNAANVGGFFKQKYVTMELVDRKSEIAFAAIRHAIFDEDTFNITQKAPVTFTANFKGIFVLNEASENKAP